MAKALVLSGGGFVGIAWQSGIAAGLLRQGIDLRQADLIVGTSGGAVCGAQLALGRAPAEVEAFDFMARPPDSDLPPGPDQEAYQKFIQLRGAAPQMNEEVARQIGEAAMKARVMPADYFLGHFERGLGTQGWPARNLVLSAVCCETGKLVGWRKTDNVPLPRAVASSCGAPGILPVTEINGQHYMDGGVYSITCSGLAAPFQPDYTLVLCIIPPTLPPEMVEGFRAGVARDAAPLETGGGKVKIVFPEEERAVFGADLLGRATIDAVRAAGRERGEALAGEIREDWQRD